MNKDVFAADIIRNHYRELMDNTIPEARRAVARHEAELARVKANLATAIDRANSLVDTLTRMPTGE